MLFLILSIFLLCLLLPYDNSSQELILEAQLCRGQSTAAGEVPPLLRPTLFKVNVTALAPLCSFELGDILVSYTGR